MSDEVMIPKTVQRGRIVNSVFGDGPKVRERHSAADIDKALAEAKE